MPESMSWWPISAKDRKDIHDGILKVPATVPAQVFDFLPRGKFVILGRPENTEELEEIRQDMFEPAPLTPQPRTLWRDAYNCQDLRELRRAHKVRIRPEDLERFRTTLRNKPDVLQQPRKAQEELRNARSEGEKALWESVVESFPRPPHKTALPIGGVCRFCHTLYDPLRRDSPLDRCDNRTCRRKADAERKWEDYHANPAVQRKKIAASRRARMRKAATSKRRATKAS